MSRFIAFVDESGDHSLKTYDPSFPVFTLCIVIFERTHYSNVVIPELGKLKLKYFNHEGVNLHIRDIRKKLGPFSILHDPEVSNAFRVELTALMTRFQYTVFSVSIRKKEYLAKYGRGAWNPYELALEYAFERVLHFMERNGESQLPVIAEARGKNEDNLLRASFHRLMTEGTYYHEADKFRALNCPIEFRKKAENLAGTQIADLCAYPIAVHVMDNHRSNAAFYVVEPHIYRHGAISGLKVVP